jgi:hypothetical protein
MSQDYISAGKTMEPQPSEPFTSPETSLSLPQPKPVVDIPTKAQLKATVDLRPVLVAQSDSDHGSRLSKSGSQETIPIPTPVPTTPAALTSKQETSPVLRAGERQNPAGSNQSLRKSAADLQETMLSANLKDMFSRASNIIQECVKVNRTIFLDASISTFGGCASELCSRPGQAEFVDGQSQESLILSSDEERRRTPTHDAEILEVSPAASEDANQLLGKSFTERDDEKKRCGILGFSTDESSSLEEGKPSENFVPVTKEFL